jgi:CBS domain-containing protein
MKVEPHMKSVMTPFPYSVDLKAPLLEARRMMLDHHVHHLPVTVDHELRGIVSDRDIKLILGPELDYPDPKELKVEDAYVAEAYVGHRARPPRWHLHRHRRLSLPRRVVARPIPTAGAGYGRCVRITD